MCIMRGEGVASTSFQTIAAPDSSWPAVTNPQKSVVYDHYHSENYIYTYIFFF